MHNTLYTLHPTSYPHFITRPQPDLQALSLVTDLRAPPPPQPLPPLLSVDVTTTTLPPLPPLGPEWAPSRRVLLAVASPGV